MTSELHDELFDDFLLEAAERLERLEAVILDLEDGVPDPQRLDEVRRELHTLKGNSGLMGLADLQGLAHELEDAVDRLAGGGAPAAALLAGLDRFRELLRAVSVGKAGGDAETASGGADGLRVPFDAVEALVEQLAQVVIRRNRLEDALARIAAARGGLAAGGEGPALHGVAWSSVHAAYEPLARDLDRLQGQVLDLRMIPLARLFRGLRRIVHDEAARVGKEVRFLARGGDTPLDKALLEVASETLGHLVRNAVIHGIEGAKERVGRGKPGPGTVSVVARSVSGEVHIEVTDDGGGVDAPTLRRRARAAGLLAAGDDTASEDLAELLFLPGVSRLGEADLGAGRGMGLASVRETVTRFNGRIDVWSTAGQGSGFRLRLPLSVSVARALLVSVDGEEYALSLASVLASRRLDPGESHRVDGAAVLPWRDGLLPLVDLGLFFGTAERPREEGAVVVVESEGRRRGLVVDHLLGLRSLVVRGLEGVGRPSGLAGSTILGDGRVVLILDGPDLAAASPLLGAA
jgi:two-component system chemotaxis sensor kinase CheA